MRTHFSILCLCVFALPIRASAQADEFPETDAGIKAQFLQVELAYKNKDESRGKDLLKQFCLPQPKEWLTQNLGSQATPELINRYDKRCETFVNYFDQTLHEMVRWRYFTLRAAMDDVSPPWSPTNDDHLKAAPNTAKPVFATFAYRLIVYDEKGGGVFSSEECFAHFGGMFRFIGMGEFPFWAWEEGAEPDLDPHGAFLKLPRTILIASHKVEPVYPESARQKGIRGCATAHFVIGADGKMIEAKAVSGSQLLTEALINAVKQWEFVPMSENGKYVQSEMTVIRAFGVDSCPRQ
jgi:TonB family protein